MKTREQALAEYEAGIRATGTKVTPAFLAGFSRGWDVRDAEDDPGKIVWSAEDLAVTNANLERLIRALRARLATAEAVISEARHSVREEYARQDVMTVLSTPLPPIPKPPLPGPVIKPTPQRAACHCRGLSHAMDCPRYVRPL